jgi:hypothetical protein
MGVTQVQKDGIFEGSQGFRDKTSLEGYKEDGELGYWGWGEFQEMRSLQVRRTDKSGIMTREMWSLRSQYVWGWGGGVVIQ